MNRTLRYTSALLLSACVTWAGVVTDRGAQAQEVSDGKVKIGVLSDMSSLYADTAGRGSVEAIKMAVEDFGGTVLGKPIEVVMADHQNKPDIGSAQARAWIDKDGVDAIFDVNHTAVAIAVSSYARERNKILMLTGPASALLTNEYCGSTQIHYVYDSYALATGAVRGMSERGIKKWFVVAVDYSYGKAMNETITDAVKESKGQIVGTIYHPFNSSDFSSFLLQAQSSKSDAIILANATSDTVNSIKTAREFGITQKQTVVPTLMFINDVHALGLDVAQDMIFSTGFYWDRTDETRQFARRYFNRMKKMPSMIQAGNYSATLTYLKAVQQAGTDDGVAVAAKLKELPINDMFATNGRIRADGRMVHDMYLVQVKKPSESKEPWDYYKILATIPGDEAFQPLSKSKCSLVNK